MHFNIALLGAGNMGSAIASALLESATIPVENLRIADKSTEKLRLFVEKGVHVSEHPEEVLENAKFVVLAVKPQDAKDLLQRLQGNFFTDAVLVSIAAGLSLPKLSEWSGLKKIIRVMPNTPAFVRMGVSGMYAGSEVTEEERSFVQKLLESFSVVIPCKNEEQIDAIGALSGSGPAYYFRILEIMAAEAERLGFSPNDAQKIALGTLRGAGELAEHSKEDFTLLRTKVTSKGGITEKALQVFEEKNLAEIFQAAIQAALKRTKELEN